jgi:hypothetical protein
MEFNRAALGSLGLVGALAIGAGAYVATRQPAGLEAASGTLSGPVAGAVNETENSISAPVETAPAEPVRANPNGAAPKPPAARPERTPAAVSTAARRAPAPSAPPPARTRPAGPAGNDERPAPGYSTAPAPVDPPVSAAIEPPAASVDSSRVAPEPPQKLFEELVIPADSVIGLQVDSAVSSENAKVEDVVKARVTRDVRVHDAVAIPSGARAEGSVTLVERGGRLKDQARLGIRFHTIVLADGTRMPINTETIYREGDSPARESAAKIGGAAVGGAVLGAVLGGRKGAIIGSTVGAAGGGVAVAASTPNAATLPAGSTVTVRMSSPATVTVEK